MNTARNMLMHPVNPAQNRYRGHMHVPLIQVRGSAMLTKIISFISPMPVCSQGYEGVTGSGWMHKSVR
jgi:hypothetical protein